MYSRGNQLQTIRFPEALREMTQVVGLTLSNEAKIGQANTRRLRRRRSDMIDGYLYSPTSLCVVCFRSYESQKSRRKEQEKQPANTEGR